MTARTSIARLADCAPVASPESWAGRKPPSFAARHADEYWDRAMELEIIFRANMARRDADAAKNGEPRDPTEFYRGRRP